MGTPRWSYPPSRQCRTATALVSVQHSAKNSKHRGSERSTGTPQGAAAPWLCARVYRVGPAEKSAKWSSPGVLFSGQKACCAVVVPRRTIDQIKIIYIYQRTGQRSPPTQVRTERPTAGWSAWGAAGSGQHRPRRPPPTSASTAQTASARAPASAPPLSASTLPWEMACPLLCPLPPLLPLLPALPLPPLLLAALPTPGWSCDC